MLSVVLQNVVMLNVVGPNKYGATTFCQLASLPTCHILNGLFINLPLLTMCDFVNLIFGQLVLSPNDYFVNWQFWYFAVLSTGHFVP